MGQFDHVSKEKIMVGYDELLQLWGRSVLREAGYTVSDTARVTVEMDSEWSGGCDTCAFEETYVSVYAGRAMRRYDKYSFQDLLRELIEFSVTNVTETQTS